MSQKINGIAYNWGWKPVLTQWLDCQQGFELATKTDLGTIAGGEE